MDPRDGGAPPEQQVKTVLDARARALARPPPRVPAPGELLALLGFQVAGQRYAVESRHVREVLVNPPVTPLPGAPDFLRGLCPRRGEPLAVYDVLRVLGLPPAPRPATGLVLVLGTEGHELGLAVDRTEEEQLLPRTALHPPPPGFAPGAHGLVLGLTDAPAVVLDAPGVLADPRLYVDDRELPGQGHAP